MCWIDVGFSIDFIEKTGEMFDVVHGSIIKMIELSIKTFLLHSQTSQVPLQFLPVDSILLFQHSLEIIVFVEYDSANAFVIECSVDAEILKRAWRYF